MANDNLVKKNKIVTKIVQTPVIQHEFTLLMQALQMIQLSQENAAAGIFEAFTKFLNALSNTCAELQKDILSEKFEFAANDYSDLMQTLWSNFKSNVDINFTENTQHDIVQMLSTIREHFTELNQAKGFALLAPYNALISNLFLALPRYEFNAVNLPFSAQLVTATEGLIKNLQLQMATIKLNEIINSIGDSNIPVLIKLTLQLQNLLATNQNDQIYEIIDDLYAYQLQHNGIALGRLIKKLIGSSLLAEVGKALNTDEVIKENITTIFNEKLDNT